MLNNNSLNSSARPIIWLSFLIPTIFWFYLTQTSQPQIIFDAQSYEGSGKMLYHNQWVEYFKSGPNREPLYPLVIAGTMKIADVMGCSYLWIIPYFQFFCIFLTQILTFFILKKLNLRNATIGLIILYIGLSPALINSALSVFSEIITYPLALGIVLVSSQIWQKISTITLKQLTLHAIILSLLFTAVTFTKAIFEHIFLFFLIPFLILGLYEIYKKNIRLAVKILVFIIVAVTPFLLFTSAYKSLNKKYNGLYAITSRMWLLYGNTYRRTKDTTVKQTLAALSYVPGENVCNVFFTKDECFNWSIGQADHLGYVIVHELDAKRTPFAQQDKAIIAASFKRILEHPIQYSFFYGIETLKMFFWESSQIGGVTYPKRLENFYAHPIFKYGIRLIISILTFLSFVYLLSVIWKNKHSIFINPTETTATYFMILVILISFILLHALIQIIPRYLFTIVPLYMITMAGWLNSFKK